MDGSRIEAKELRVTDGTKGPHLHITLADGREMIPIPVVRRFVKDFACMAIRATPTEKL